MELGSQPPLLCMLLCRIGLAFAAEGWSQVTCRSDCQILRKRGPLRKNGCGHLQGLLQTPQLAQQRRLQRHVRLLPGRCRHGPRPHTTFHRLHRAAHSCKRIMPPPHNTLSPTAKPTVGENYFLPVQNKFVILHRRFRAAEAPRE